MAPDDNKITTILYKNSIESFFNCNKFSLKTNPAHGQTLNDKYKQKAPINRSPTFRYTTYTPNQMEVNAHYEWLLIFYWLKKDQISIVNKYTIWIVLKNPASLKLYKVIEPGDNLGYVGFYVHLYSTILSSCNVT